MLSSCFCLYFYKLLCSVQNYAVQSSIFAFFILGPIYGNMLSTGGKPLSSPSLRHQQQLSALQHNQSFNSRRVPPEVPKRTSSITIRYKL